MPLTDHEPQIDHVGSRQDLCNGPVLHKLLVGEPLFFLNQLPLHHRQDPSKALKGQFGE